MWRIIAVRGNLTVFDPEGTKSRALLHLCPAFRKSHFKSTFQSLFCFECILFVIDFCSSSSVYVYMFVFCFVVSPSKILYHSEFLFFFFLNIYLIYAVFI